MSHIPGREINDEQVVALKLSQMLNTMMDEMRAKLPVGTEFSLFILTPPEAPVVLLREQQPATRHLIMGTTNREVMLPQVAHWVVQMFDMQKGGK